MATYANGYQYRKKVVIDSGQVSGSSDLTDFPILVNETDADFASVANGGYIEYDNNLVDIRLELSDETKLPHKIEKYDSSTGQLVLWVKFSTLNASSDTVLYIYYGKTLDSFMINGIEAGFQSSDIEMFPNQWDGSANTGELDLSVSSLVDASGSSRTIGDLGWGIATIEDDSEGLLEGYVMYSDASVHTRFSGTAPNANNADHFIAVVYDGGQWKYDNNSVLTAFTPVSTDLLVARLEWGTTFGVTFAEPISIDGQEPQNTIGRRNEGYRLVMHMGNTPDVSTGTFEHRDGSYYKNDGSSFGGMGAGSLVDGIIGDAIDFDGSNDRIQVPDSDSLKGVSSGTISLWVNLDTVPTSDDMELYIKSNVHSSGKPFLMWVDGGTSGKVAFLVTDSDSDTTGVIYSTTQLSASTWHHIAITWEGSGADNDYYIYIDGVAENSLLSSAAGGIGKTTDDAYIGADGNGGQHYLDGKIDELRFVSRARSSDWLTTEYNNQSDPSTFYSLGPQNSLLSVDSASHAHTAEQPDFVQDHHLTVDDTIHSHLADNITVTENNEPPSVVLNTADEIQLSTTPTLEFTGTDPSGDDIRYQIQIDDDSNFSSPVVDAVSGTDDGFENTETPADTDPFNSGEKVSFTVGE